MKSYFINFVLFFYCISTAFAGNLLDKEQYPILFGEKLNHMRHKLLITNHHQNSDLIIKRFKGKKIIQKDSIPNKKSALFLCRINNGKNNINLKIYRGSQLLGKINIKKEDGSNETQCTFSEFLSAKNKYIEIDEQKISKMTDLGKLSIENQLMLSQFNK